MKRLQRVSVFLVFDRSGEMEVGELILREKEIFFQYHPAFLETGLEISPFKLPLAAGIRKPDTQIFDGLFGVFNDSLPEGWGRLLLDRALLQRGISPGEISPLDRLSLLGPNGMGALIYRPQGLSLAEVEERLELSYVAREAQKILEGSSSDVLEELVQLGGSSGGARPKILVGYNPQSDHLIYGQEILPEGYEHWIIKFPATNDFSDIAQIEYAYYQMAIDAGIEMSVSRLFEGASGDFYFGTKRFDRQGNRRLHLHSASGLLHDNFRLSNMDYGHLMDAAFRLENHIGAYEKVLRIAAFNVFAHNRDDHSKNFSFLMDKSGKWRLAPAYDLTFSASAHGFHSTTVAGEGKSPDSRHLLELAGIFDLDSAKAKTLIGEVQAVVQNWSHYAESAGVSSSHKKDIDKVLAGG